MARIPQAELDRLKAEVSVERLAETKGVELKRRGKELVGKCPFHEEDTPSLSISPEKNVWRCFGCEAGGSVVDWVMRAEGVSFPHAVEILRAGLPEVPAARGRGPTKGTVPKHSTVPKLPGLASADTEDRELLQAVVAHYHETLKASPEAMAYLEGRGLGDREMVERFRLGYANRSLGYRLPQKNRRAGAAIRGRLTRLGVLRARGHEHLAGSLVVPLFDAAGEVGQLYGRKIRDDLRPGTATHLYLPLPQRQVWNREGILGSPEVILCEALFDALTFWSAGYRNVTTSYGTNTVPEELWEVLAASGCERLLIAFDRDEAGERGAERVAAEAIAGGLEAWRIQFPKGMDANEYATKVTPAAKSLELVIRNAVWMGKGERPGTRPGEVDRPERLREMETRAEPVAALPAGGAGGTAAEEGEGETGTEGRTGSRSVAPSADPTPPAVRVPGPRPSVEPALPGSDVVPGPGPGEAVERAAGSLPGEAPTAPDAAILDPLPSSDASRPEAVALGESRAMPPAEPRPVTRVPRPGPQVVLEPEGATLWWHVGDRHYRIRGLEKNTAPEGLKVNLGAFRDGGAHHIDVLDLSASRPRHAFVAQAASELGLGEEVVKRDVGLLLLTLEDLRDERLRERVEPRPKEVPLSAADREAALTLLRSPDLLDQVLHDFDRAGVVGETTNKLVGYLAAVSRKLPHPLAVVIQSNSAAGKSSLQDAVLSLMPEEERAQYSAMTGQSLFYMSETDLRGKILAIAEEEGAERASYALKLLQSEGVLVIASTGKDPTTGRLVTHEYRVEGPVMIFLTTTAIEMDEELLNRCLVLSVDEGREQTRAIHRRQRQRETLAGLLEDQERGRVVARHRNAQRLLRPLLVVNPFAERLTFLDHQTRSRRDHMKYLTLIKSIALLHQYQREVKTARTGSGEEVSYIEVTREDIRLANHLAHQVLGRSLDELPPQTRRLLGEVVGMVADRCREQGIAREDLRFTRREVREWTGMGNTQLKLHLNRLEELEYLLVHAGGRGQNLVYELAYQGGPGSETPFFPGLLDLDAASPVDTATTATGSGSPGGWSGSGEGKSGSSRGQVGPKSGGGRDGFEGSEPASGAVSRPDLPVSAPYALSGSGVESLGEDPSGRRSYECSSPQEVPPRKNGGGPCRVPATTVPERR